MPTFEKSLDVDVDARTLYDWHARPGAFARLVPPWEDIEVVEASGGIEDGARRVMKISQGPVRLTWEALHRDHVEGRQFVDEQVRGPFKKWVHTHRFEPRDGGGGRLVDHVDYELPLGPLGRLFGGRKTRTMLERMFTFRHRRTAEDLRRHTGTDEGLRVAITGSSGMIGSALQAFLTTGGHQVVRMVRDEAKTGQGAIFWSPPNGEIDAEGLEGVDAVVHLAGEEVVQPWTDEAKDRIRDSRVEGTRLLAETLAGLDEPPEVLLSASTVCYYGNTGDRPVGEDGDPGTGFLSDVARQWEAATEAANTAGIRTVRLRIGVVLSPRGGTLARLLPAVRYGLASRFGGGDQYVSWVDLDDVIAGIYFLMNHPDLEGPFNLTAPQPVENRQLLEVLGDIVRRPNGIPIPDRAVEWILDSGVARETVLADQRVLPRRLQETDFEFFYDDVETSLSMKLGVSS